MNEARISSSAAPSRSLRGDVRPWRATYGGMKADEAKRLKRLEGENQRLKKLVDEQPLDIDMLKDCEGPANRTTVNATTASERAAP